VSYLPHLALLAGIWTLVVVSPGPDFVVTVSRAASSRRAGLARRKWPMPAGPGRVAVS
jgi:threonine/homoserine/homoserine lactone efflux protein